MTFANGQRATFNDTDSDGWGQAVPVTVERPLTAAECDAESGQMFRVVRDDGASKDAFADELESTQ
jgi:hypothetical protein